MLKPVQSDATIVAVWHADPAVDQKASGFLLDDGSINQEGLSNYIEAVHKDPAAWRDLLKFKPDQHPTEFVIGVIKPAMMNRIEDEYRRSGGDRARLWAAFVHGVQDISNFGEVKKVNGEIDRVWLADQFSKENRMAALAIGGVAWSWQHLGDDDAKNS